jgi:hypothetical protein
LTVEVEKPRLVDQALDALDELIRFCPFHMLVECKGSSSDERVYPATWRLRRRVN